MQQGYIKLYRKMQKSPLYKSLNSKQRDIMINLLLMANHEENRWIFDGKEYNLKPGQMITSLEGIKEKCAKDVSIQNIRTCLLKLEKGGFLTNKSTNKNRLITIENWELYQSNSKNQQTNSHATNKQLTTNKNVKNEKNNIYSQIQEEFNSICVNLSSIKKITDSRKRVINARVKEYGLETILEVFNLVNKSSFLNGNNERCWKANFDWIMNASNFTKILEGNYNDTKQDQSEQNNFDIEKELEKYKIVRPDGTVIEN